jgi:hypothetical protein
MDVFQYEGLPGSFIVAIRDFTNRTSPREHE